MTLEELLFADEAKSRAMWDGVSYIACMIYNVNISKKSQAKNPSDFHPWSAKEKERPKITTRELYELLKAGSIKHANNQRGKS